MKAYVITIKGNKKSEEAAARCIASGKKYGVKVDTFYAITPEDNRQDMAKKAGIESLARFNEVYSRSDRCLAAFLSHFTLWMLSVSTKEELVILEHDAVFVDYLTRFEYTACVNLGRPSYGKWNVPKLLGINPLTSKRYFPGAHAYMVKPVGAAALLERSKLFAGPTDVFLNMENFDWLQEYYPWPIECKDSFTTIQSERGCLAKHNYSEGYEIV